MLDLSFIDELHERFYVNNGILYYRNKLKANGKGSLFNGKEAGCVGTRGYRQVKYKYKMYPVHRIIYMIETGVMLENGMHIDHINGDRLDNRIENLRVVTCVENCRNAKMPSNNTSGVNGVHKYKRKWKAMITVDFRLIYLGLFSTLEEAIKARKLADIKYGFHANHGRVVINKKRIDE